MKQTYEIQDIRTSSASTVMLRVLGVVILLTGLYGAYQVVERAWMLFEKQETVVKFAEEIEKHAHLNAFLGQMNVLVDFVNKAKSAIPDNQNQAFGKSTYPSTPPAAAAATAPVPALNASYLMAWILTLVLLGLIGRISFWAITAGGKLALFSLDHDEQLRGILRQLIQEVRAKSQ